MSITRTITGNYTLSQYEPSVAVSAATQAVTLTVPPPVDSTGSTILLTITDATNGIALTSPVTQPPQAVIVPSEHYRTPPVTTLGIAYSGNPVPFKVTLQCNGRVWTVG